MNMANIACAPVTVTRTPAAPSLTGRVVLLLAGALLAAATPPDNGPKPDPSFPFSNEIEAFARADSAGPKIADAILFLGSSSIRLWDIAASFPDARIVNRGFGGATTRDVLHYYKRLLPPTPPSTVIVYVGENDLATGTTPDKIARDALTLLGHLRTDYPRARIAFLSLKPSPIRWTLWPRMAEINAAVAARAGKDFDYLDVGTALLAPDGLPDAQLFRPDGLHMNPRGYARWTRLVSIWLAGPALQRRTTAVAAPPPVIATRPVQ